jgi:rfaE bifunctional protein nucleotidyltransferase chain/domain
MKKVWVNGCFDIVHSGHLYLFTLAKSLGEVHVGLDSDDRIEKAKGKGRPIFNLSERMLLIGSLKFVDHVHSFNSDSELSTLINYTHPDFMLVGEEYKGKNVIGSEYAKEVIYVPKLGNCSTSNIENKIIENFFSKEHKDYFGFINDLVKYNPES